MKMIILILKDNDSDAVTQALTSAQYRVTRVASTGGFLRSGVVTLLLMRVPIRSPLTARSMFPSLR